MLKLPLMKKDLINLWIKESESYLTLDKIEGLLQSGQELSLLPVQPLYVALKNLPVETVANALEKLSPEQRELFLDLDLWTKDTIDINSFEFWVQAYHLCQNEEVKDEFVKSNEFLLFLKSKFNIWTFDVEEPEYPDHDNYFLTDDMLLLVEFEDGYEHVHEIKELIKHLYYMMGVEYAYTFLFKMVSDSFLHAQEEEYQFKKSRLSDVGIVDYYDSLEIENCFPSKGHIEKFVQNKENVTARLDPHQKNQGLHHGSLVSFKDRLDKISEELDKVNSSHRIDYLHFNFIRLVNGTLTFSNAMKNGSLAMTRVGNKTRSFMELGFEYVSSIIGEKVLFEYFDFTELYKVGHSLAHFIRKDLKSALIKTSFEVDETSFLGQEISGFLDLVFSDSLKLIVDGKSKEVETLDELAVVEDRSQFIIAILPFIEKFYQTILKLEDEDKIKDEYYLNFDVRDIDFEALILSSFANYTLGYYEDSNQQKMGLSLVDLKNFLKIVMTDDFKDVRGIASLDSQLQKFFVSFGMDSIPYIKDYLYNIISDQFVGYEFDIMTDEEYKHVGGVILLNLQ